MVPANLSSQQRMIDAAEVIPADEDHGSIQPFYQVNDKLPLIQRDQQSAGAFYDQWATGRQGGRISDLAEFYPD